MQVGIIKIDLIAHTGRMLAPMKLATVTMQKFERVTKGVATVLGTIAMPLAGLAAGALTTAGAVAAVKRQFESIDEAAKVADRLGIATEELTSLQHAAELAGVSTDELTTALQYMLKQGFNISDLGSIAEKMNDMTNPAERMAYAMQTFGRGGAGMINVLAGGAAALGATRREAEELGLTFSRLDAAQIEEANDAITRMKAAFVGMARTAAIALAPFVEQVANVLRDLLVKVRGFAINWKYNFNAIAQWLQGMWKGITEGMQNNWRTMLQNYLDNCVVTFKAIEDIVVILLRRLLDSFKNFYLVQLPTQALAGLAKVALAHANLPKMMQKARELTVALVTKPLQVSAMMSGYTASLANQIIGPTTPGEESQSTADAIGEVITKAMAQWKSPLQGTEWEFPEFPELRLAEQPPGMPAPDLPKVEVDAEPLKRVIEGDLGIGDLLKAYAMKTPAEFSDVRVGAMERGSQQAFSAIFGTQKRVEEQQLEEAKHQTELLQLLATTRFALAMSSLTR